MSHYTEISVEIRREHQDCLIQALTEVDTRTGKRWTADQILVHDSPVRLEGYKGDKRQQRAHVVIPRAYVGSAANDLGVEWTPDGKARLHISEFDAGFYGPEWVGKLQQRYAVAVAKKTAPVGYQVRETTREDGTIVLEMVRA